jgi:propanediol dehydratase small subunit
MGSFVAVLVALTAVVGLGTVWAHFFGGFAPEPYRTRACQGRAWKRAFPDASKEQVREFLETFAESFAFRSSQRLQFAPEDCIMAVYRAIYPRSGGADGLELETLALKAERSYGLRLADVWSDRLTFGELFAKCAQMREENGK